MVTIYNYDPTCVRAGMDFELLRASEPFSTNFAHIRLFPYSKKRYVIFIIIG